jgi:hypothetical protein
MKRHECLDEALLQTFWVRIRGKGFTIDDAVASSPQRQPAPETTVRLRPENDARNNRRSGQE